MSSSIEMLYKAVLECFLNMAVKNCKSGVWLKLHRVDFAAALALCSGLGSPDAERKMPRGDVVRSARMHLDGFRKFHHWSGNGHGLCSVDRHGMAFFVIGAACIYTDPGVYSLQTPSMKVVVEVHFILFFCSGCFHFFFCTHEIYEHSLYILVSPVHALHTHTYIHRRAPLALTASSSSVWSTRRPTSCASTAAGYGTRSTAMS